MRALALIAAAMGAGCGSEDPRRIDIGVTTNGAFTPLADGDRLPVSWGTGGLYRLNVSLRAFAIDPHAPDERVTVAVGGSIIGTTYRGTPRDMTRDGPGWVLPDVRLSLNAEGCCFDCRSATIEAQLTDAAGEVFRGEVTGEIVLRGACPEQGVCCSDATSCADPELALVCE